MAVFIEYGASDYYSFCNDLHKTINLLFHDYKINIFFKIGKKISSYLKKKRIISSLSDNIR